MAEAAKVPLTALEKTLLVVGVAAAGAVVLFVGAKIVQAVRVAELKRAGAPHVHRVGLTGAVALLPLASGNMGLTFLGFDREQNTLELEAPR
jgi:hypothetical protein